MDNPIIALLSGSLDTERDAYIQSIRSMVRTVVPHSPEGLIHLATVGAAYHTALEAYHRDLADRGWRALQRAEYEKICAALGDDRSLHMHTHSLYGGSVAVPVPGQR